MADWLAIKAEYCSTDISYRKIAEKHGVSFNTLKDRAVREGWKEQRDTTHNKIATTTQQKIVVKVSNHEVDRLTRILALGDTLLAKAERAAQELDQHLVTHKHRVRDITYGDPNAFGKPTKEIIDDTEIVEVVDAPIDRQGVKQLASALKDLNDIAKVSDPGKDESLTKARELLEGLPSAID